LLKEGSDGGARGTGAFSLSCSSSASSCSRFASRSKMMRRMPAKFSILASTSRISQLAIFLRMLSISSWCIMEVFSFLSLCTDSGVPSGMVGVSSSSFRPRETRRRCFLLPVSVKSGKLAWKPWKSE